MKQFKDTLPARRTAGRVVGRWVGRVVGRQRGALGKNSGSPLIL